MTTSQTILSIFELLLVIGVFVGIFFEYKLIDFEIALKEKIKKFFKGVQ
jgi:hypothetical protein